MGITTLADRSRARRSDEMLAATGMESCQNTRAGDMLRQGLSGGQRRRLSLAMALVKQPKLVILDECDAMTSDAQFALRRVIEKYVKNVRFCLICNYVGKIISALQSRCTKFRFGPLSEDQMLGRLREVIEAGCTAVYLEKPGAPTVAELEDMKKYAAEKKVPVYMGYNKNVTPYVRKALEEAKKAPGSVTTYVHNNAYTEAELPECFERNAEGARPHTANPGRPATTQPFVAQP